MDHTSSSGIVKAAQTDCCSPYSMSFDPRPFSDTPPKVNGSSFSSDVQTCIVKSIEDAVVLQCSQSPVYLHVVYNFFLSPSHLLSYGINAVLVCRVKQTKARTPSIRTADSQPHQPYRVGTAPHPHSNKDFSDQTSWRERRLHLTPGSEKAAQGLTTGKSSIWIRVCAQGPGNFRQR